MKIREKIEKINGLQKSEIFFVQYVIKGLFINLVFKQIHCQAQLVLVPVQDYLFSPVFSMPHNLEHPK